MAADTHEMRIFQLPDSNESDTMLKYYSTRSLKNVLNLKLIFRFNGGHLGFSSSAYVRQHSPYAIELIAIPQNMVSAFGISILSCLQAEIHMHLRFNGGHLGFSTSV